MDRESQLVTQNDDEYTNPTYNLKAVVQETGLKADTLRAWERRYGLPQPTRAESGHRLYSKRDIHILKWLLARQSEGLSISRAVAFWQRLIEDGVDPIDPDEFGPSHFGAEPSSQPSVENAPSPSTNNAAASENGNGGSLNGQPIPTVASDNLSVTFGGHIRELRREWVSACLSFDEARAEQIVTSAFSLFEIETVCIELILKGISEIGNGWAEGRVTVQQEHFASSLATRRIHALLNGTPGPTRPGKILIGCPAGEEHALPSDTLALLLRRQGWSVIFLGANIPTKNLIDTVITTRPSLVIVTVQQLRTAATLLEMGTALYNAKIPMAYGGSIFSRSPALQHYIPGFYLGDDISNVPIVVEQLMSVPHVKAAQRYTPSEYEAALDTFRRNRTKIEAHVWHILESHNPDRQIIQNAHVFLGQMITVVFSLCRIDVVKSELRDVGTLLRSQVDMPIDLVGVYFHAYYEALRQNCYEAEPLISELFTQFLDEYQPM